MDPADDLVTTQRGDHALDLPPVAEADDIAGVAAAASERGRLEARVGAEALADIGGVGERGAAVDIVRGHGPSLSRRGLGDRLSTG
jgi:hypothetical protein